MIQEQINGEKLRFKEIFEKEFSGKEKLYTIKNKILWLINFASGLIMYAIKNPSRNGAKTPINVEKNFCVSFQLIIIFMPKAASNITTNT